jgi:predicted aspartyl protease
MGAKDLPGTHTRRAVAAWLTAAALSPVAARAQTPVQTLIQTPVSADPALPAPMTVKAAEDEAARMTVPVMLNGQGPFPFVVDTGSNRTVISDTLALQLGLPAGEILQVSSATGVDPTPSAHIARLSVGRREVSDLLAPVLIRSNLGAVGMLGIDAVADQTIIMNFKRGTMSIQPASRRDEDPNAIVVRGHSKYGQLILVDSDAEGAPLYVIIDTGAEMTMGNLKLRDTVRRRRAATGALVEGIGVTGGRFQANADVIQQVSLGHVTVRNLPIDYADMHAFNQFGLKDKPAMLLGMSTLRLFDRVWVDFKNREVRFLLADSDLETPGSVNFRSSAPFG